MPTKTLTLDVEVDEAFVSALLSHIERGSNKMDAKQKEFCALLIAAIETGVPVRLAALREPCGPAREVIKLADSLRRDFNIPVFSTTGALGGYWLPVSVREARLCLRAEAAVQVRRITKTLDTYNAMKEVGMREIPTLQHLETVLKIQQLEQESDEGEFVPPKKL
jgi:hypothetical protein